MYKMIRFDSGGAASPAVIVTGLGVFVIAAVVFFAWVGSYLTVSLTGPDVTRYYSPLVRHQISQVHCYDNGSQFCEKERRNKPAFEKEFTIGYLFWRLPSRQRAGFAELYSCVDPKDADRYTVTVGKTLNGAGSDNPRQKCKEAGLKPFRLGYISQTPNFEAPTKLYICDAPADEAGLDQLLTDDPRECELVGYENPTHIGYIASAGHLPLRRLTEVCAEIEQAGGSVVARALCEDHARTTAD